MLQKWFFMCFPVDVLIALFLNLWFSLGCMLRVGHDVLQRLHLYGLLRVIGSKHCVCFSLG